MNGTISVLCPTRGRQGLLVVSIRLLRALAARPDRVEVLLAVDDDDPVDYENEVWPKFTAIGASRVPGKVIRMPRMGYAGLHHYYNALSAASTGHWNMLWNDDIFMTTKYWDRVLDGVPGPLNVVMTESNHGRSPCTFPFFTRRFAEVLGHVSLNAHNDTWIEEVGRAADILVDVPILVLHALTDDETAREGKADGRINKTSASFYTPEATAKRAEDAKKLREWIAGRK